MFRLAASVLEARQEPAARSPPPAHSCAASRPGSAPLARLKVKTHSRRRAGIGRRDSSVRSVAFDLPRRPQAAAFAEAAARGSDEQP